MVQENFKKSIRDGCCERLKVIFKDTYPNGPFHLENGFQRVILRGFFTVILRYLESREVSHVEDNYREWNISDTFAKV